MTRFYECNETNQGCYFNPLLSKAICQYLIYALILLVSFAFDQHYTLPKHLCKLFYTLLTVGKRTTFS